jgi:aldose 1-epimerase
MAVEIIGQHLGEDVREVTIRSPGGAEASVMTFGAGIRDMAVPLAGGRMQRVVLGFPTYAPYPAHSPYFGVVAGRVANRIRDARFTLDGEIFRLPANEGAHCLHGGPGAIGERIWTIAHADAGRVTMTILSPDGENGFPGDCLISCTYRFDEACDLVCELTATTDRPTPINLAQHNYYNLDGSNDAGAHELVVFADVMTPNDPELIPTGEIRSLAGGPYDFRARRPIATEWQGGRARFDASFVLPNGGRAMHHAATLHAPSNGLSMEIHTDAPALQFYDGHKLDVAVEGHGGMRYGACAGVCFEPQNFPNAVNTGHFPNTILRPGEVYRQRSLYRFLAA